MTKKTEQTKGLSDTKQLDQFQKDEDFRSLYINNISFGFTRFDFQMTLGIVEISKDQSADVVRELASVKMTQAYAKALLNDLANVIGMYEAKYGEIVMPPDLN